MRSTQVKHSAVMEIEFRRTGERRYGVIIHRAGHTPMEMNPAPGYDPLIPHDLLHFIVENELGLRQGIFGQIAEGTLVGVINFPANTSDFRGQGIKAGFYTLRYALILQDGNHLGVSPARDFFLICPAADDKDPNAAMKMEDLLKLSRAAAGAGELCGICAGCADARGNRRRRKPPGT